MSEPIADLDALACHSPQLQGLNEKIARLAAIAPWADIYRSFSATAQLAGEAIEAAKELQEMPGTDRRLLDPVLNFWCQVRNFNCSAALAVVGENRTLAEALVAFRLLHTLAPARARIPNDTQASAAAKQPVV
jgi:hypothetical protein